MAGKKDVVRCSFCRKPLDAVHRLISGPNGAFICDECVDICHKEFDSVAMMHEVVPGVLPLAGKNDATERIWSYYVDVPNLTEHDAVKAYCEYLSDEGFHLKDASDTSYTYFKVVSYPEVYLEGHFELEIRYDENNGEIVVDYYIDDSPYEE